MPEDFNQERREDLAPPPAPAAPPANDPEYERFASYMKSYLGADPQQLAAALQQNQRNTLTLEQQRLRQEWGDQYDGNYAKVQERLQQIAATNPAQAQALNNADGALLLARALAYDELQSSGTFAAGGLNRSSTPATPAAVNYQFTASGIRAMTADERRANHQAIQAAYQQGLVDRNS